MATAIPCGGAEAPSMPRACRRRRSCPCSRPAPTRP